MQGKTMYILYVQAEQIRFRKTLNKEQKCMPKKFTWGPVRGQKRHSTHVTFTFKLLTQH